ncbi:restriction endonuclease [Paracidovorax anthurii]|uniref:Restriction system protein n=1 Tax=Paracidovorax anthurii TaxID=78229 RepID=A0A328Z197_9BURK|nr:restriction endonuclease [Paracidovorax anthurii]RAR76086.1 restriction system protein [Paracidovorax anthurii]
MPSNQANIQLADWQLAFIDQFISDQKRRTRLVASAGMGKTTVARYAAHEVLRQQGNDYALIISHHSALAEYWRRSTETDNLILGKSIDDLQAGKATGLSVSSHNLHTSDLGREILALGGDASFLVIVDEADDAYPPLYEYVGRLLAVNEQSRVLSLFTPYQGANAAEWKTDVDAEYFFQPSVIALPESRMEVARLSPSHAVLQSLLLRPGGLDELHWRQFEKLIAELLEADGYTVELMQGTKDGGVDVIAVKDHGPLGLFKTLWQAKKKNPGNKVGLSIVRELADTRNELGASKAFIVTSTYLTRDAIKRIQRDCYQLGKLDRDDLNKWISRVLYGPRG